MKVLHVVEAFGGGILQVVVALAERGAERGQRVLIAFGERPETPPPTQLRERIDRRVALHPLPWRRRTLTAQLHAARELRRLARELEPDVIHLHSSFAGAVGTAALAGRAPIVWTPNAFASSVPEGSALRRRAYRALEARSCRRADLVGAVSHSEADLARRLGARSVVRVANGIPELDPERVLTRAPDAPPPDPPRIVAGGRTVPQRRPEACAHILAAVSDVTAVEWLGGGGGKRGVAGKEALERAGITPTGWLPREEAFERTRTATAYLHWTAWDGLPLSVLEALSLDVPVVASDIPPNREILGDAGVCASEEDAIRLLRRIVAEPKRAEELRAAQRSRRGEFSATKMAARWDEVYRRLVDRAPV